jgi:23S rRNA (guanosine2251-2'-O)-methyltransferase
MGDFLKQAEEILGERLHAADAERLHKLTGHDRHQGVVALAEKMTIARTITEVVEDAESAQKKSLFLVLLILITLAPACVLQMVQELMR